MSMIALYIAPFALESPFDFTVHPLRLSSPAQTNYELNSLVKELQDVWKTQDKLPDALCFPENLKWVLFCPERMTFLCRANYSHAFLERSGGTKYGKYIVVPEILALRADFLARMRELIPSQVPYITYVEALNPDRRLCPLKFCTPPGLVYPRPPCSHFAKILFHTKGVKSPILTQNKINPTYHLAIWIPGTMLPWEVLLPTANPDPTSYITYAFKAALTAATSTGHGQHTLNELLSLGYYPTGQNWMLIDFLTGSQIHKSCVPDLRVPEAGTSTYIVGSAQCGPLTKKILAVIKEHGAPGWPGFWEDLVSTQKLRAWHVEKSPIWTPASSASSSEHGD
ncbi:hypothetical protein EV426DRAFT_630623 [Tirmania nivea]|nr:hypothetical protein EV426DRAFT_630623 [Tirmania nivea]